jgi:hypothetical protein
LLVEAEEVFPPVGIQVAEEEGLGVCLLDTPVLLPILHIL